jgi:uncharacterized protein with HEPN domain
MQKDDRVYLDDMLAAAKRVRDKMRGISRTDFDADENLRLAVTHLLQIIGEAAFKSSPAFRDAHPEMPWRPIMGMRHRIVHDYTNVNDDIIWQTVQNDLAPLIALLETLLLQPPPP